MKWFQETSQLIPVCIPISLSLASWNGLPLVVMVDQRCNDVCGHCLVGCLLPAGGNQFNLLACVPGGGGMVSVDGWVITDDGIIHVLMDMMPL